MKGAIHWSVPVKENRHVLVYYPALGTADLFIHGRHSEVPDYHGDVSTGMRNAANFARRIGAHLSVSTLRSIGLTAHKPNVGKGRWAKRK